MNLRNVGRIGLLPLLLGAVACSDMDPANDTFATVYPDLVGSGGSGGNGPSGDSGSGGSGGAAAPMVDPAAWDCLSNPMNVTPAPMGRIKYQVVIVDFDTQPRVPMPVQGLVVEVCANTTCDRVLRACDETVGEPTTPVQQCVIVGPGPVQYTIDLPYGLDYSGLKLTAPGYVQMNYLFGGPMIGTPEGSPTVVGLPIPLLTNETRARVYQQVQVGEVDLANGTLAVRTLSCAREPAMPMPSAMPAPPQGQRAAQIQIETERELPPPAVHWTLSPGNTFDDDTPYTDARGVAGILNVPPQTIRINAVLPNGQTYGQTVLPVVANAVTLAELRPGLERWGQ
jgi:hypothetical protein